MLPRLDRLTKPLDIQRNFGECFAPTLDKIPPERLKFFHPRSSAREAARVQIIFTERK